jgi:hypothetical protein
MSVALHFFLCGSQRFCRAAGRLPWWVPLVVLAVGFSVLPVLNGIRKPDDNKDYTLWYAAGEWVRLGWRLYPAQAGAEFPYLYPPFLAVCVLAPLGRLPFPAFVAVLAAVNSLAWVGSLRYAARLSADPAQGRPPYAYALAAAVTLPFVWDIYLLGQWNLILLFLLLAGFAALREERPLRAGLWIALAAAIKGFPILAAGWLLWRRQGRALAALAAGLVLFLLILPGCVRGFGTNFTDLVTWAEEMTGRRHAAEIGPRSKINLTYRNQSLKSVVHRLLRPVPAGQRGDGLTVNVLSLSPAAAEAVFWGVVGLLCLVFVRQLRRARPADPVSRAVEESMLLCLIVFCSPIAWTYFYCWLLFPVMVVTYRLAALAPGRRRQVLVAVGVAAVAVLASALTQSLGGHRTQALGATAWGALLTFLLLAILGRAHAAEGIARI